MAVEEPPIEEPPGIRLRRLLRQLAEMDFRGLTPASSLEPIAHAMRDCRLELISLEHMQLTESQLQAIEELDYRLQQSVKGMLSPEPLSELAKKALIEFNMLRGAD
jgi:hypothetical protein